APACANAASASAASASSVSSAAQMGTHRRGALAGGALQKRQVAARQHQPHPHLDIAGEQGVVGDAADPGPLAVLAAGIDHRPVGGNDARLAELAGNAEL